MALAPWAFSLALLAFLSLFLQPGLSLLSWRGLGLWLGMLLALTLVSLVYEGGQYWLARQTDVQPELRVRPWALLAALLGVALSRLVGFLPGYFYSRLSACAPPSDEPQASTQPSQWWRQVILVGLGAVGAIGFSMWLLTIPTSLLIDFIEGVTVLKALTRLLSGLVGLLQSLLLLGFFVAWQTLFFELLPLQSFAGGVLFRRNRLLWAGISCLVLFVLLHTLLNPLGASDGLWQNKGLLLLLLSLFLYSALAVAVWFYFARRPASEPELGVAATRESWERDQLTAVLAISLVVIWVLGACYGLLRLVMGWLS
jgi:hypothetical protein